MREGSFLEVLDYAILSQFLLMHSLPEPLNTFGLTGMMLIWGGIYTLQLRKECRNK